jgi:hypothetical protein
MLRRLIYCTVAALLLSGCWPARITYRPGIAGTVLSAEDGTPVIGASVEMTVPRADLVPVSAITTSNEGRFEVEAYYRWGLAFALGERWPAHGTVEISAPGFAPRSQQVIWSGPRTQEMGAIRLERLP